PTVLTEALVCARQRPPQSPSRPYRGRQGATPKRAPTAAVTAIASAPQKVTRRAPVAMGAPPAFAAIEPRDARKTSDTPATYGIRCFSGTRETATTGTAAPSAERDGRREGCLERPRLQVWGDTELIANMRAECVLLHELPRDLLRETRAQAASAINSCKFCPLAHLVFRKLAALDVRVRFLRVALRAYGNILASGHRHGACDETCDARYKGCAMGHILWGGNHHGTLAWQ